MTTAEDWDRLRRRWRESRRLLQLDDTCSPDFGTGGLARHAPDVRTRLLILPADPAATLVNFDEATWEWWLGAYPNPFDGAAPTDWGNEHLPTADAAVRCSRWGDDRWNWDQYLALHRSGALEFGLGPGGGRRMSQEGEAERWAFFLTRTVGRIWWSLDRYTDVIDRFGVQGPWQLTLAFRGTVESVLANVAAGWIEPWDVRPREMVSVCPDLNVAIVREFDAWPDRDDLEALAMSIGGLIEDAWGSTNRRFLARIGDDIGTFDVSRYG